MIKKDYLLIWLFLGTTVGAFRGYSNFIECQTLADISYPNNELPCDFSIIIFVIGWYTLIGSIIGLIHQRLSRTKQP